MPDSHTITMNADGPTPNPLPVHAGDSVTFTNNTGADSILTLPSPSAFVPAATSPETLANGASAGPFTANANGGSYSYTVGRERDPRGGTIDVN